jgi:predicted dehydrogenase
LARGAQAAGRDEIRIALVGCGGRGTGAAVQALKTRANVRLVAMADAFKDALDESLHQIEKEPELHELPATLLRQKVDVPKQRQFTGLHAYQQAIDCGVDLVLLCTPPGFRPAQFEAAVKAGKHVFLEKPVAVDAPGVRRVAAANQAAKQKGLAVAVGHHLRHETKYRELVSRIHRGQLGKVMFLRVYFNGSGGKSSYARKPGETELQYQVRNWYYFDWLSGDHIVEQHVHDLDIANWIVRAHPTEAQGMGGRQVRVGRDVGEIFDHHAVEFTYPEGVKVFSYCRQIPACWDSFSQHVHGVRGTADLSGYGHGLFSPAGQQPVRFEHGPDGHQVEMDDLMAAVLAGTPYNEADWAGESTMTAILGRMASYSGQPVKWSEAVASPLDLMPKELDWNAPPRVKPGADGCYACALPGVTKAW